MSSDTLPPSHVDDEIAVVPLSRRALGDDGNLATNAAVGIILGILEAPPGSAVQILDLGELLDRHPDLVDRYTDHDLAYLLVHLAG